MEVKCPGMGLYNQGMDRGMKIQRNVRNLKGRMQDALIQGPNECKVQGVLYPCWTPHTS